MSDAPGGSSGPEGSSGEPDADLQPGQDASVESDLGKSSLGLDPNLAGLLCYLFGIVTGLVFVILEKDSRFVRFHAFQSLGTFGVLFVVSVIAGAVPLIGPLVGLLVSLVGLALWVVLMVKAFQGERFKLPVVGDWAEQQAGA